uniref:non-specific serine/threonine protein kinase n=1 Tax=Taiwania cryptomerioides TaxID=50187 RepID=A0A126X166_TAICR|nr:putative LOV domain-containing protein [Taiwania cryptomerioides]
MDPSKPGNTNNTFPSRMAPDDLLPIVTPISRDSRGSLEVFNPAGFSAPASASLTATNFSRWAPYNVLRNSDSSPYKTREDREDGNHGSKDGLGSQSGRKAESVHTWMAFSETDHLKAVVNDSGKETSVVPRDISSELGKQSPVIHERHLESEKELGIKQAVSSAWPLQREIQDIDDNLDTYVVPSINENFINKKYCETKFSEAGMAERVAEWGLILKTDDKTGKPQGVAVRTSGESRKSGTSRRTSGNSMRTSEESDCGNEMGVTRISKELKDALSTFQQTFVVSDATKPDYPILYASAGFFKMTGYAAKEVIGRNCRFLQGAGTDPEDVSKIREALAERRSYCGRLLNYKKDGTPFWNLLTIAPIKDETGKTLKFIGMLVEVSKHTEGEKEKMVRPNGLPESLIRYDARQKEMAVSSVTELVLAVKHPCSFSESTNRPTMRKSESAVDQMRTERIEGMNNANPEFSAPNRRKSSSRLSAIFEVGKKRKKSGVRTFMSFTGKSADSENPEHEQAPESDSGSSGDERPDSLNNLERRREIRRGLDLATTLERIEKNFVITDPRLPDNPIIFASDSFLELTEYTREEILGKNCRFLQGPETDRATVKEIREAIDNQMEVTVQLINYTKSGKKFWNIFHLQPMRDQTGEVQYFIGVQLDGSQHVKPLTNKIPEQTEQEGAILVKNTATNVDEAVRELPDANMKLEDLWINHSKEVFPKPHMKSNSSWKAIQKILEAGEQIGLKHFKPIKSLGYGDTGSVHLVELYNGGDLFAMKTMDKTMVLNRNKVHRVCTEREILDMVDHPFIPTLYASFQTKTHLCLVTDYCPGGELFMLIDRQPTKVLREDAVRFYAAEVVVALEYLHCQGIIYRDLKPENVLIQRDGHVMLTDFDLSCLTSCKPQVIMPISVSEKKKGKRNQPMFIAEPIRASNSFVGTEEYIAPEIINGAGHSSAVDWWALGVLLYEMLYGYTPFRGKTRQKTFANILHKDLKFPKRTHVSMAAIQLILGLLHREPVKRLGSCTGANEIKQHPFFQDVNWALVRTMKPPKLDAPIHTIGENVEKIKAMSSDWSEREALLAMHSSVF